MVRRLSWRIWVWLFEKKKESKRQKVRDGECMFWEKKEFVIKVQKDSSSNTQVINSTKEGDGSAIRMR